MAKTETKVTPPDKRLSRLSLFFFRKPRTMAILWIIILGFGILSYTTLMRREGFPTINIPYSLVNGSYLVGDPAKVDNDVAKPLSQIITKQPDVQTVDAQSGSDFYTIAIQYKDGTDAKAASADIEKAIRSAHILPQSATAEFKPLSPGIDIQGHDIIISYYSTGNSSSTEQMYQKAAEAAKYLKQSGKVPLASSIEAVDPFARGVNPTTGQPEISQQMFDRYAVKADQQSAKHFSSVVIGIKGVKDFDVLELDKQVHEALDSLNNSGQFSGFKGQVSYSAAPDINDQITGLQHSLVDGLIAILIVSALLIALRAAIITVLAMVTVLTATLGVLYLLGYSLNTITLFSLILCLSLIVDDTIIMVEAIDAERRKNKNAYETIRKSTGKISRAMVAATLTATIGFLPLLFVSGILGSFIKAIPVTVVTSLLVSLFVALSFIPFFSKFLLLRPKQLGHAEDSGSPLHKVETKIAGGLAKPLMWARHSRRRLFGLGITAIVVGFGFIFAGGFLFQKVAFDIFPADKDGDIISAQLTFPPNQTIEQTQATAEKADKILTASLGENFKALSYYNSGNSQTGTSTVVLLSFKKRSVTAPQLSKQLEKDLNSKLGGTQVKVSSQGVGPPSTAFNVYIETDDREAAFKAAEDMSAYLTSTELVRVDGTKAHFKSVTVSNPNTYSRNNGNAYIAVGGEFDGTDTTTLVNLAQDAVKKEFNDQKMKTYGLNGDDITFNIGTQEDFQKSFNKLAFAFPLLLVAIYLLLITQFRSLLQPLLIFMAIPFSLFGISVGLWLTHNPFSFFTLLGFFALLGLSIKNTILLTDYANQARRAGAGHVESVAISLQERFRPLVATSLTAIISLIPLYLSNPFWEGLTVTLMFGLLSSTFLVLIVFPYYYLGGEYLMMKVSRKAFVTWLVPNIVVLVLVGILAGPKYLLPTFIGLNILAIIGKLAKRRFKK
ncbi:efflux RND transporter permease subunit [Candidatus Saccharibacteria bacterium]|nr:efflux RND transporter permease subunit [Candidatus Saccharibacteria bacterium]